MTRSRAVLRIIAAVAAACCYACASRGPESRSADAEVENDDAGSPQEPQPDRAGPSTAAAPRTCDLPVTCVAIATEPFVLDPCCPTTRECGYKITRPAELGDGSCKPASEIFLEAAGADEKRIVTAGAPDQLITPDCETRVLIGYPLIGCCMPNNHCGVSTYQVANILLGLAVEPAPFTRVECVAVETLNAQFQASSLAGFGQLPASQGNCNYGDLATRLKNQK